MLCGCVYGVSVVWEGVYGVSEGGVNVMCEGVSVWRESECMR